MTGHYELAYEVITRGLGSEDRGGRPGREQALSAMVPDYRSEAVKSMIRHRLQVEIEAQWPGLTIHCDLMDDTTVDTLARQLSVHVAEWFGD